MNDDHIGRFRDSLLQLEQALVEFKETGDEAAATVTLDQTRVGRLSRMDALQRQAMSMELQRRRELERNAIAAALRRVADGEYGYCVRCGEAIAIKRLESNPAAALCIECATVAERDGA